jgi:hypothetical protein
MRKLIQTSILVLALFALAACGDDNSSSTGPAFAGPDLSGTWTGTWRDGSITMVLDQNGANVTGTVTRGSEILDLNGTVSATGVFEWGAVTPSTDDCIGMASTVDDFQTAENNTKLSGVASRNEGFNPSVERPCGTRILRQQGEMNLQRAF